MDLPISPEGRRYGYRKDPDDSRDLKMKQVPFTIAESLPESVDLEQWCGPVKDQGSLGACTAFAGTGNLEYLFRRYNQKPLVFSPLFLYYMERKIDGDLGEGDTGSYGRTSCKAMNQYGVCLESVDGYDTSKFEVTPTDQMVKDASTRRSGAYHKLHGILDIKSCIASQYPVLVGFTVYDSFESNEVASTGIMPMPDTGSEMVLGGHEVLFIGYNDSKRAFKVRNSWGLGWGDLGNFWFPYQAVQDNDIFQDGWIQHLGPRWK